MSTRISRPTRLLLGMLAGSLVVACEPSPAPRLETSPSVGVAVGTAPPTPLQTAPQANVDARSDIYVVGPKTGEATPLVSAPGPQGNAEVSPDGTRVVYESRIDGFPSQIVVTKADGKTLQLTHMAGGAFDPTWSPDGTQIAFAGTRLGTGDRWPDSDIFVVDVDGGRIRRFASTKRHDGHPDWSSDGSRIAFHSRYLNDDWLPAGSIWVASASTGTLTKVIGSRWWAAIDPAWSPDGRWIAYGTFGGDTLNGRVYTSLLRLVRPNGTRAMTVRDSVTYHLIENPSWSPDGRSIVFEENSPPAMGVRWDGSFGDIGIIDVHGERLRWIVRDAPSDQPSWARDGILVNLTPDEGGAIPETTPKAEWPSWDPSWTRPDATVVLTGTDCELDGDPGVLDSGVLTIEFVNESYKDATFKVVRVPHGRRLDDLGAGPSMAGGWGERNAPSGRDIWSSPRAITSGRWAVVCFKDLIAAPNGFLIARAGIVGPIEIG